MNLKEIIEATLIELDRGTAADTVAMYADKFTMYANEAVNEIARRFKACKTEVFALDAPTNKTEDPTFDISEYDGYIKRVTKVWPTKVVPADGGAYRYETDFHKPLYYYQPVHGAPFISVRGGEPGGHVMVEFLYKPTPMKVESLANGYGGGPNNPDIPESLHELIPIYVRAREQCGQDPSTQGTSSAFFSLFNQKVYQLQRETMATPESFKFIGYNFE